jgi:hypothetical protein
MVFRHHACLRENCSWFLVVTSSVAHDPPEGGEGLPRSLGPPAIRIGSQGGAADYAEAVTFGDVFDADDYGHMHEW